MNFFDPERHAEREDQTHEEMAEELKLARIRLQLASAYVDMHRFAYEALLHHGVNFHTLPAYLDTELLDRAMDLPVSQGHDAFVEWMARIRHDIRAAVARKSFRKV